MHAIRMRNISKTYGSRFGAVAVPALRGVSMDVARGEFVAVMGPSGAGKTTLLHAAALIDPPDSGSVFIDGQDSLGLKGDALADFRRRKIGFVFQDSSLLETLTLRENIELPLALGRVPRSESESRSSAIAASLGIGDISGKYPSEVSIGQRQRAAAARAVIIEPVVLLADEPTGALDSRSGRSLLDLFAALNAERGTAVLMATHDPFAASWARRVLFLRDGGIFTEIRAGNDRREFFDRIMEVQAAMAGSL